MSRFRFERMRIVADFFVTFVLAALLSFLVMTILDLDINRGIFGIQFSIIFVLVAVIIFSHFVLCQSRTFFWKFAFLLPDEIYYYILARRKCNTNEKLIISLNDDYRLILSKPEQKPDKLEFEINAISNYEAESIIFLLQKKSRKKVIIENRDKFDIIESQYGSTCGWNKPLDYIYLLFSKNAILLLGRSLLMTFIFLAILFYNPPIMIVAEPMQIQENWSEGEVHPLVISAKNIGCDLLEANLLCNNSSLGQFINVKWSEDDNPIKSFKSGHIKYIRLNIDNMSPPGDYRGSIIISSEAQRIRIPDPNILTSINISIIGRTYTKKLVEVPFFIRITPKLNSIG